MSLKVRLMMGVSFACTSMIGVGFILMYWLSRGADALGFIRAAGFIGIMAGIHFVAYRQYQREESAVQGATVPRHIVWRVIWSALACTFYVLAINQFVAGYQLRVRILELGRTLDSVPPTMLGADPAFGVALTCIATVSLLIGFRPRAESRALANRAS
jgi:hypothetical protein